MPRRSPTTRSSRSTEPPRSRATAQPLRALAEAPPRRSSAWPASGRAGAAARGRGRPAHSRGERSASGAAFPRASLVVAPATGHSVSGRLQRLHRSSARELFQGRPWPLVALNRGVLPAGRRPRGGSRTCAAQGSGRPRPHARGGEADARDVAEDSVTELIFDLGDPDVARGGGLRPAITGSTGEHAHPRRRDVRPRRDGQRPARALRRAPRARAPAGGWHGGSAGCASASRRAVRGVLGGRPVHAGLYARGAIGALATQRQHRRAMSGR